MREVKSFLDEMVEGLEDILKDGGEEPEEKKTGEAGKYERIEEIMRECKKHRDRALSLRESARSVVEKGMLYFDSGAELSDTTARAISALMDADAEAEEEKIKELLSGVTLEGNDG